MANVRCSERKRFLGLLSIEARSLDTGHGRLITALFRAWPFSVAPRPLGPTFRPRGSSKCSSWPPAGPRGPALPPGCPPLHNVLGDRRHPPGSGRRAPPWVVGGSPADAPCGKRLRLPALPAHHVGIGLSGTVLGGGPADEHSGLSVVSFQCCRVGDLLFFLWE